MLHMELPQFRDCIFPQQYYTCAFNGFGGCCAVDPCNLSGCPVATTLTTRQPSRQQTTSFHAGMTEAGSVQVTLISPTVLVTSRLISSRRSIGGSLTEPTHIFSSVSTLTLSTSSTSSFDGLIPDLSSPPIDSRSKSSGKVIVAGVLGSVGALALIAIFTWLCFRLMKKRRGKPSKHDCGIAQVDQRIALTETENNHPDYGKFERCCTCQTS